MHIAFMPKYPIKNNQKLKFHWIKYRYMFTEIIILYNLKKRRHFKYIALNTFYEYYYVVKLY